MVKKKSISSKSRMSGVKVAYSFFIFVLVLVLVSLALKLIAIASQSVFDAKHRFNLEVSVNGKNRAVFSFEPESGSMVILKIPDKTISSLRRALEIPIDGNLTLLSSSPSYNHILQNENVSGKEVSRLFLEMLYAGPRIYSSITTIDMIRLMIYSYDGSSSPLKTAILPQSESDLVTDKLVASLFSDQTIRHENESVSIINGTEVSGLGNRLARLISNMGGNVVVVSTSSSVLPKTRILYVNKKTYTLYRMEKLLNTKAFALQSATDDLKDSLSGAALSDIIVVIGKENMSGLAF